jgi:Ala-tRNA(Pro) deacylase
METTATLGPNQGLIDWLSDHNLQYELHEHALSFTARETALAEGIDPDTFAKVVCAKTGEGRPVMFVLKATDHLDMRRARHVLGAHDVHLMNEADLDAFAPGCEVGAIPAIGDLFQLPVYADYAIRDDALISFNAGTHRHTVRVDRAAWETAANVIYAELAEDIDRRPAWISS